MITITLLEPTNLTSFRFKSLTLLHNKSSCRLLAFLHAVLVIKTDSVFYNLSLKRQRYTLTSSAS